MLKRRRRNGFTLIELVVVIAILGILAGLGIMRLLDANKEAKRNTCLANRTTLSHELSYQEAQGVDPATYFASVYSTAENSVNRFRCPSGGTYTLNATTLEVSCSDEDHTESSIGAAKSSSAVDVSKLNVTAWKTTVEAAQEVSGGFQLQLGTVYTDTTGTYFVYSATGLSQKYANTNPTLEAAIAAGAGIAKLNTATLLTQIKQGNKTVWSAIPKRGDVYYDGTNYYAFCTTSGYQNTQLDVAHSNQWTKISK